VLLTPRRAAVKDISVGHGDLHISKSEPIQKLLNLLIPPSGINFLIAAVQLPQQQQ